MGGILEKGLLGFIIGLQFFGHNIYAVYQLLKFRIHRHFDFHAEISFGNGPDMLI